MPSFARLRGYVDALPDGLASWTTCAVKGSLARQLLDDDRGALAARAADLPEPLAALLREPPPPSAWVPEVHVVALTLASADAHRLDDDAFVAEFERHSRHLLASPMYKSLMAGATPDGVLRGAATRWSALRRGTFVTADIGANRGTVRVVYPHGLIPPLYARARARTFLVTLQVAGARDARVELVRSSPEFALYECAWSAP